MSFRNSLNKELLEMSGLGRKKLSVESSPSGNIKTLSIREMDSSDEEIDKKIVNYNELDDAKTVNEKVLENMAECRGGGVSSDREINNDPVVKENHLS